MITENWWHNGWIIEFHSICKLPSKREWNVCSAVHISFMQTIFNQVYTAVMSVEWNVIKWNCWSIGSCLVHRHYNSSCKLCNKLSQHIVKTANSILPIFSAVLSWILLIDMNGEKNHAYEQTVGRLVVARRFNRVHFCFVWRNKWHECRLVCQVIYWTETAFRAKKTHNQIIKPCQWKMWRAQRQSVLLWQ